MDNSCYICNIDHRHLIILDPVVLKVPLRPFCGSLEIIHILQDALGCLLYKTQKKLFEKINKELCLFILCLTDGSFRTTNKNLTRNCTKLSIVGQI